MEEVGPPKFSAGSKSSLAMLYRPYNDVEVYIEDETCEELFRQILLRVLPGGIQIKRVVSLGGKLAVLKAISEYVTLSSPPKFFIIDGDLDRLQGNASPLPSWAFRLEDYCIENYLIQEDPICSIVHDQDGRSQIEQIHSKVGFSTWISDAVEALSPLFAAFAFLQSTELPPKTVADANKLATDGRQRLSLVKAKASYASLLSEAESRDPNARKEIEKLLVQMGGSASERKRHICGKVLLVCLTGHVNRFLERNKLCMENFRFRLAKLCDYSELEPLGIAVAAVLKSSRNSTIGDVS